MIDAIEEIKNKTTVTVEGTITSDNDLTGYSLLLMIKNRLDEADADALVSKTGDIDANKSYSIVLTPTDTDLEAGDYVIVTRVHLDENNSYPYEQRTLRILESGIGIPDSGSGA